MKTFQLLTSGLLAAMLLTGCGGGGGGGNSLSSTTPPTGVARTEANPNLPSTADMTLGTSNSFFPLTVGTVLTYKFSGVASGSGTLTIAQGGSNPIINLSGGFAASGMNGNVDGQTQGYTVSNNGLYQSNVSIHGTIDGLSGTVLMTTSPPIPFFPMSTTTGYSTSINSNITLKATADTGQSETLPTIVAKGTVYVTGTERISTLAGTFDSALKIEYRSGSAVAETRWFVAGIGQVKFQMNSPYQTGELTSYLVAK